MCSQYINQIINNIAVDSITDSIIEITKISDIEIIEIVT